MQQDGGSIGYVEYAYVIENHMTYVDMINKAGKHVAPTMSAFQAAAANADFSKVKDFYLILTDQPGPESWPITAATYMLLRKDGPEAKNHIVLQFLDWCLKNGQAEATALDYVHCRPMSWSRSRSTGRSKRQARGLRLRSNRLGPQGPMIEDSSKTRRPDHWCGLVDRMTANITRRMRNCERRLRVWRSLARGPGMIAAF